MQNTNQRGGRQLFFLGFLTLFLELVLIRYLSGNVWNLGYFPNLVLLAVFLGMGTGFAFQGAFLDEKSERWLVRSAWALGALVLFASIGHPTMPGFNGWEADFGGELYFTARKSNPWILSAIMFGFWFLVTWLIFLLISQRTGKLFRRMSPLRAYSLDIGGSCCGILAFMAISFFKVHALYWFFVVGILYLATLQSVRFKQLALIGSVVLVCSAFAHFQGTPQFSAHKDSLEALEVRWSPYQKLKYISTKTVKHDVLANGIPHQAMHDAKTVRSMFYQIPYDKREQRLDNVGPYKSVLILGAGSGNDVTAALLNGVDRVDAVEIDPVIVEYGTRYHPAKPYQDSRVHTTINDGRAFISQSKRKYDLIVFALTDSILKVSPVGQLRLENYLFTKESVERAYQLLEPNGDLLFYNYYRRPWISEKIKHMLYEVTGRYPKRLFQDKDFVVLAVGENNYSPPPKVASPLAIPTDNWPFLYVKEKTLPVPYLVAMGAVVLLILGILLTLSLWRQSQPKQEGEAGFWTKGAFLLMGAAFLLLETKSIIQFALLFGTTWLTNSLVFLGILVLVLLANWCAKAMDAKRSPLLFFLLLLSCLFSIYFPLANLLAIESLVLRFVLASLITFLPIFFANLIFSLHFRNQKVADQVFGWNLLGAGLGGVLEYTSLVIGYSALGWIVLGCYSAVYVFLQLREKRSVSVLQTTVPQPS